MSSGRMSAYSSSYIGSAGPDGGIQGESVSVSFDLVVFSAASPKSKGSFIPFLLSSSRKAYSSFLIIIIALGFLSLKKPSLPHLHCWVTRKLLRSQSPSPKAEQLQLSSLSLGRRRGRHHWGQGWMAHLPLPSFPLMGPAGQESGHTAVTQYLDRRGWLQSEGRALSETLVAVYLAWPGG